MTLRTSLRTAAVAASLILLAVPEGLAQSEPEVAACKASGLIALQETSPDVKELVLDTESLIVAKANTHIQDIPVKGVVTGDAYLKTDRSDKPRHMICIVGEKGKVLMTFFTQR
jgi:hypothetical protein